MGNEYPHSIGITRRDLLATAGAALSLAATQPLRAQSRRPDSRIRGVQVGVISYSFRSMADQSAEAILRYCVEAGVSGVELMGDPAEIYAGLPVKPPNMMRYFQLVMRPPDGPALSSAEQSERAQLMEQQAAYRKSAAQWRASVAMQPFERLRRLYNDAGVDIYGFKPATFEADSTPAEIDYGMRAAKALGASHVTVELPRDAALTQRLGDAALKQGLRIGYHQHLQATPTLWDAALAQSRGNGINLDIGHYVAAGAHDPLAFLRTHHERITSMHIKDRRTKANGQANLPWGSGDTPLRATLQLMRDQRYSFPATIELEYDVPSGSDAVREVARCVDYCRQALNARS